MVANGPWDFQWYSNNLAIPGAIHPNYTTVPLVDELDTRAQYHVVVSNGADQVASDSVHLILLPDLPPGGIFYDGFNYPAGALGNWGEWTLQNIAQVASPGLTYTDGTRWLAVGGNATVPPIDWDPFESIPIKLFGDQTYGGPNSTNFMSFLFDFRNLNPTNNAGYVGVSGFEGNGGWGSERFFVGKTWYSDTITVDGRISDSTIPYQTNGFLVPRITQDDTQGTYDLFLNPPLDRLPDTPTASGTADFLVTFNAVGVNAGEWAGVKGNHNVPFTEPGPIVDEFRFGATYASVAPIAVPTLSVIRTDDGVSVSWAPDLPGFSLQSSDSLLAPIWVAAPAGSPGPHPGGSRPTLSPADQLRVAPSHYHARRLRGKTLKGHPGENTAAAETESRVAVHRSVVDMLPGLPRACTAASSWAECAHHEPPPIPLFHRPDHPGRVATRARPRI